MEQTDKNHYVPSLCAGQLYVYGFGLVKSTAINTELAFRCLHPNYSSG